MDTLAANKDITSFHLNIGLCLQGGGDPVGFINQCPGRIQSLLIQDYKGQARWKEIFASAETKGGLQFYLIQRTDGLFLVQREGDDLLDFARKDLEYFRELSRLTPRMPGTKILRRRRGPPPCGKRRPCRLSSGGRKRAR